MFWYAIEGICLSTYNKEFGLFHPIKHSVFCLLLFFFGWNSLGVCLFILSISITIWIWNTGVFLLFKGILNRTIDISDLLYPLYQLLALLAIVGGSITYEWNEPFARFLVTGGILISFSRVISLNWHYFFQSIITLITNKKLKNRSDLIAENVLLMSALALQATTIVVLGLNIDKLSPF